MSGGTINVNRGLFGMFKAEPFTQREAWVWLMMEASWKDRTKPVGNAIVSLRRGQLAVSIRFMAEAWSWSKSRVDRFIDMLEKRDMIVVESGTGHSIITICNYDEDQGTPTGTGTAAGHQAGRRRDSSGTAAGQTRIPDGIPDGIPEATRLAATKPVQTSFLAEERPAKAKRKSCFPAGWIPSDDLIAWAEGRGFPRAAVLRLAERCVAHHLSKGTTFASLDAAFRTWVMNEERFESRGGPGPNSPGRGQPTGVDGILRRIQSGGR